MRVKISLAVGLILMLSFNLFGDVDLENGLVAYYPFNGNANDESGNGNNGAVSGATLTADRDGNENSAFNFDGYNDYIVINNPFENNIQFSISIWVNPSTLNDGSFHGFIGKQDYSTNTRAPSLWLMPHTSGLHYDSNYLNTRYTGVIDNFFDLSNQWINICWVNNGEEYKIFRDGELIFSVEAPIQFYVSQQYWIGRVDNYFNGSIDEVRIYNRAISDEEVQFLYQPTPPPATQQQTIPAGDQTEYTLVDVDTAVQFTENHIETELDITQTFESPNIVENLPAGVENIANRFWTVISSAGNVGSYEITFDLTGVGGIQNFGSLRFLKRADGSSEWQDVVADLGANLVYNAPFITIQGLNAFSDFVPAGGNDNTLPVELSSFSAIQTTANFAQLNWQTQSETGLAGYNVYRNTTENFENGLKLNSLLISPSNTSSESNYSFTDESVEFEHDYFYWLESVESDGSFEYFGPISIRIESEEIVELPNQTVLHSAFPNPFNPKTTIKFSVQENETANFEIFNLKGQIVKSYPIFDAGNHEVNWSGTDNNGNKVSSGVFFYKLKSESVLQVQKMLLLK